MARWHGNEPMRKANWVKILCLSKSGLVISYVTFTKPQNHLGEKLFGGIKYADNLSRQDWPLFKTM